jgi:predicted  nucleic acid-binding Zn-ribbon protein
MSDTADEIEAALIKLLREIAELKADLLAAGAHIEGLSEQIAELQADIDQCPFHGPVARWDLP